MGIWSLACCAAGLRGFAATAAKRRASWRFVAKNAASVLHALAARCRRRQAHLVEDVLPPVALRLYPGARRGVRQRRARLRRLTAATRTELPARGGHVAAIVA
jgi:hypothetical protein